MHYKSWAKIYLLVLCIAALSLPTTAHELRSAYLQIEQIDSRRFDVMWRVPARGELRLSLDVHLGLGSTVLGPASGGFQNGFYTERWQIYHPNALSQLPISIDGLEHTLTDVLVRIAWLDGNEIFQRLMPERTGFTVGKKESHDQVTITYFKLGLEHILLGIDHLLFVLALMLLCSGWQQLLLALTGFTLAHSITLGATTLGHLSLPQAPVEVIIALSIVFIAREILAKGHGYSSLTTRLPWLVAFAFGLLHGLGFAGALADIGLPQSSIPLALLSFNLGVEAGQILFVAITATLFIGFCHILRLLHQRYIPGQQVPEKKWERGNITVWIATPIAYSIGAVACWWCLDRTLSLLI